jgi:hypothetical protein
MPDDGNSQDEDEQQDIPGLRQPSAFQQKAHGKRG